MALKPGLKALWERHPWLRRFNYFSRYMFEDEAIEELWFIQAPSLSAAKAELRKALKVYIDDDPENRDILVTFLQLDIDQYKRALISNVKAMTRENLARRNESSPIPEEDVPSDLYFLENTRRVTHNVYTSEVSYN